MPKCPSGKVIRLSVQYLNKIKTFNNNRLDMIAGEGPAQHATSGALPIFVNKSTARGQMPPSRQALPDGLFRRG
jgi:hypothetical protein